MNERLPAPCEPCHGSGMRDGTVCSECRGKGYHLLVNGKQLSVRQEKTERWQDHPTRERQR